MAELKQEGIDLASIQEIRDLLRAALTEPDPERRARTALALKQRFGLDADPALYGRLERLKGGWTKATFSAKGLSLIREMTDRTSALYDALLRL